MTASSRAPTIPADTRTQLAAYARETGLDVVPVSDVADAATAAGLPPDQVAAVTAAYGTAQLQGLRLALGAVALFSILGLWFTRRLPAGSGVVVPADDRVTSPAPSTA